MQWRVCLFSGRVERHVTEVKTTRVSDVRQKAKATARSLLDGSSTGSWRRDSKLSDYIERESIPAIERNQFPKPLRPNTQVRYVRCLALLADELRGMAIADATRPRQLNDALASIASKNGTATARQCGKVASKYVMRRLVTDEVLDHNPLRDLDLELPEHIARRKPQGGQALTPDERDRVIAFLIEYVPETLPQPKRGRYSAEQRTAIRQRAVDVTLLQADTGLRINEACRLTRDDVDLDADPLTVSVTAEVSKTHRGRTVPVLDPRVSGRIRERLSELPEEGSALLFGAPAKPECVWDSSNRQKAIKALYHELADTLDIPLLHEVSSHVWRATLNTEWMQRGVPDALRSAFFGHSVDVNRESYTDLGGTEQLVNLLRSRPVENPVSING